MGAAVTGPCDGPGGPAAIHQVIKRQNQLAFVKRPVLTCVGRVLLGCVARIKVFTHVLLCHVFCSPVVCEHIMCC